METTKNELRIAIPRNNQEDLIKEEAFEVLKYFKNCAEEEVVAKHFRDLVCILSTKQGAERHQNKSCYNEDAILIAIDHIKKAGYFVWFSKDYKGQGSYWITTRKNSPRPHSQLV